MIQDFPWKRNKYLSSRKKLLLSCWLTVYFTCGVFFVVENTRLILCNTFNITPDKNFEQCAGLNHLTHLCSLFILENSWESWSRSQRGKIHITSCQFAIIRRQATIVFYKVTKSYRYHSDKTTAVHTINSPSLMNVHMKQNKKNQQNAATII